MRGYIDDFEKLSIDDVRRLVGGRRKLREAESLTVHLNEMDILVQLVRGPANLGNGLVTYLSAPCCGRRVTTLRIVPGHGLLCVACVRRFFGAIYLSQVHGHKAEAVATTGNRAGSASPA